MSPNELFISVGILRYVIGPRGGRKVIVEVDQGVVDYYRSLIPRCHTVNRQLYPAHISVVRKELVPNLAAWGRHDSLEIPFVYSTKVERSETYWWLNVWSERLEAIRLELGLTVSSPFIQPPDERWRQTFHISLANSKLHIGK